MKSSAEDRKLKDALVTALIPTLERHGFEFVRRKTSFVRRVDGMAQVFQLIFLEARPGWRVQLDVGVRFDEVEDIFHRSSGFYQR